MTTNTTDRNESRKLRRGDKIYDELDGRTYFVLDVVDLSYVELFDNNGRALPDYRHLSQVKQIGTDLEVAS